MDRRVDLEALGTLGQLAEAIGPGFDPSEVFESLEAEALEDDLPPLEPAFPERCSPPVRLRPGGGAAPDPWATLGLPRGASEQEIRTAYRRSLAVVPPEEDRERASRLNDARSLLLDPERVVERQLGEVRVPDPDAWGLRQRVAAEPTGAMPSSARMMAQLLLYALVEEELLGGDGLAAEPVGPKRAAAASQRRLFD